MSHFLSETDCATLKMKHRLEKDRRVADRIKAVLLSNKGWSYRQIAEALFIDEQTISRHVEEYKVSLKLTLKSGGSVSKLDRSQTARLVLHLETVLYAHVPQIMAYVEETYGVRYSRQGMTCWLHHHGFGYKKPQGRPYKADYQAQSTFITTYEHLKRHTPEDEPILFGDGVHPTMATKISYGWIKSGTTKTVATTASRTRVNLMGALNLETMQVVIGSYDTLDTQAMVRYFDRLRASYPTAPQLHLILDRSRYNTSLMTQEAAKCRGINLHYLPPYSPNLNPIERLWKVMNEQVRNNRFFKQPREFREALQNFFEIQWPKLAPTMTRRINDNFSPFKSILPT